VRGSARAGHAPSPPVAALAQVVAQQLLHARTRTLATSLSFSRSWGAGGSPLQQLACTHTLAPAVPTVRQHLACTRTLAMSLSFSRSCGAGGSPLQQLACTRTLATAHAHLGHVALLQPQLWRRWQPPATACKHAHLAPAVPTVRHHLACTRTLATSLSFSRSCGAVAALTGAPGALVLAGAEVQRRRSRKAASVASDPRLLMKGRGPARVRALGVCVSVFVCVCVCVCL